MDGTVLIVLLVIGALIWWAVNKAKSKKTQASIEAMHKEATAFLDNLRTTREFPAVANGGLLDKPTQPLLFTTNAELLELKTTTSRAHVGTRVNIGSLPLYLGRSDPISKTEITGTATGVLAVTTKALVFAGNARTQNMPLHRITSVDAMVDAIQVSVDNRAKPMWFKVQNPLLVSAVIQLAAQAGLSSRQILENIS